MTARSKARKRALDVLFESDLRGVATLTVLADRLHRADPPIGEYAVTLVEGVAQHRDRIDDLVRTYAQGWELDRMPAVDRAILRLAIYELMYEDDVPDSVVIDEAVELAKQLSTDESPAFINGLLARILAMKSVAGPSAD